MTAPLYNELEKISNALLSAAEEGDGTGYAKQYADLVALCYEYSEEKQNHPLQWEILADFTEEPQEAISFYQKALGFADEIQDFSALYSSQISLARLYQEIEQLDEARMSANAALDYAEILKDKTLQAETDAFISSLSSQ